MRSKNPVVSGQLFRYRVQGIRFRELSDFCLVVYPVPSTLYLIQMSDWGNVDSDVSKMRSPNGNTANKKRDDPQLVNSFTLAP